MGNKTLSYVENELEDNKPEENQHEEASISAMFTFSAGSSELAGRKVCSHSK